MINLTLIISFQFHKAKIVMTRKRYNFKKTILLESLIENKETKESH